MKKEAIQKMEKQEIKEGQEDAQSSGNSNVGDSL